MRKEKCHISDVHITVTLGGQSFFFFFWPEAWIPGSEMIMSSVVRKAVSRWATERSISVFMELIQYRLFKLAGQRKK